MNRKLPSAFRGVPRNMILRRLILPIQTFRYKAQHVIYFGCDRLSGSPTAIRANVETRILPNESAYRIILETSWTHPLLTNTSATFVHLSFKLAFCPAHHSHPLKLWATSANSASFSIGHK